MGSAIISFLSGLIVSFLKEALADWRRDQELKKAGAADAALETSKTIAEAADAQHQNDLIDRGGAADVADRLRERLRASGNQG